jgi:hypothetical protein
MGFIEIPGAAREMQQHVATFQITAAKQRQVTG